MNQAPDALSGVESVMRALEREVLTRASLVIHNYCEEAIGYLREQLGLPAVPALSVRPGLHPELARVVRRRGVRPTDNISVVYCGTYVSPGDPVSPHADFLRYWKWLADAGTHVHVYYSGFRRDHPRLAPVRRLLDGHPYFHLYDSLPFAELFEIIQQHDFLWAYFPAPIIRNKEPFRRFIGSNTCFGLSAGLPVIVSEHFEPLHSIVARYGNGLALPAGLDEKLPEILKAADRAAMRRAAEQHRAEFLFPARAVAERVRALLDVVPAAAEQMRIHA